MSLKQSLKPKNIFDGYAENNVADLTFARLKKEGSLNPLIRPNSKIGLTETFQSSFEGKLRR